MFDLILNIDNKLYKFYKKDLNSRHFIFIYTSDSEPKCKFYKEKVNKNYVYIKITSKLRKYSNGTRNRS